MSMIDFDKILPAPVSTHLSKNHDEYSTASNSKGLYQYDAAEASSGLRITLSFGRCRGADFGHVLPK